MEGFGFILARAFEFFSLTPRHLGVLPLFQRIPMVGLRLPTERTSGSESWPIRSVEIVVSIHWVWPLPVTPQLLQVPTPIEARMDSGLVPPAAAKSLL